MSRGGSNFLQSGYACPVCGGKSEVGDSRQDKHGNRRRIRFCEHGHRFVTVETVVGGVMQQGRKAEWARAAIRRAKTEIERAEKLLGGAE